MNQKSRKSYRRITMNAERKILLKLTEILEKERLISQAEKNRVDGVIERGGL